MIILVLLKIGLACASSSRQWHRGAAEANSGEFPFLVHILYQNNPVGGGLIINERSILTVARLVHKRPSNSITISIPELNRIENNPIYFDVELYRIHPNYRFPLADIAMLKLAGSIELTSKIKPIVLETNTVRDSVVATLIGSAYDKYPGGTRLEKIHKVVLLTKKCVCELHNLPITNRNICSFANSENANGEETCIVESGYPLILRGKLIGMVSYGASCSPSFPNVFTRATCYRTWIRENTYK